MQNEKIKCYAVPVQKACNLRCFFCSTNIYLYNKKELMEIDEVFFDTITLLKQKAINCFEITGGGEPFLNPNLQEILCQIRKNFPDSYIKLYTNGRIRKLFDYVDELNISVIHWNAERVHDICNESGSFNLIEMLSFFRKNFFGKIRLSIPMLKQAIANAEDAKYLVGITQRYVDQYVFRPMNTFVPNYDFMATFFDLDVPNVEIDKDFCSCNEIDLWFSDNHLYKKWDLSK
jgi:molybdenum cofactor biosynthesis enzyme MoaA